VRIVGVLSDRTVESETVDGVEVRRVPIAPLDSRIVRDMKRFAGSEKAPSDRLMTTGAAPVEVGSPKPAQLSLKGRLRQAWAPFHEELVTRDFAARALEAVADRPGTVWHAHDLNAWAAAAAAQAKWGGKLVFDAHEFYSEKNFYRKPSRVELAKIRKEERDACRAADCVITVSESIADELQKRYAMSRRPVVVMNCPSYGARRVAPFDLHAKTGGEKVLVYIGLATFNRGIEVVIQALADMPGVHCALLGPVQRGYEPVLRRAAKAAGVEDRFHIVGAVAPEEVVATAATADAAVLLIQNSCLSYYYCSPNKLFEALAAGLPVVASDFPDLRRILTGHEIGRLCKPDDVAAVRTAILDVLARPREVVREKAVALSGSFSWEQEERKLLAVYHSFESQQLQPL
jgi:glycosyltransferase involved in cell wall biosynthesis